MDPTRLQIPLLEHEPSETPVFTAANLLEAARLRKGLPKVPVPAGCLLDFDGELVQHLADTGRAAEDPLSVCAAALEVALEYAGRKINPEEGGR